MKNKRASEIENINHHRFVSTINNKFNGKIKVVGKYTGYKNTVDIQCSRHGIIKGKKAGDVKRSKFGCNLCAIENKQNKIADDIVINKAKKIHNDLYSYDESKISKDFILNIYCKNHKRFFNQNKKSHLQGHSACKDCQLDKQKKRNTKNLVVKIFDITTFINEANRIHQNKYDYSLSVYKGMFKKINIICKECNKIFNQTPNDHIHKKNGCQKCAQKINTVKLRLTKEDFLKRAYIIHNNKYDYDLSKFIDSKTKIKVYCKKHKEFFYIAPGKLLDGQGCRKCGKDNIKLELKDAISKSKFIFNNKYNYEKSALIYRNDKTYFKFYCNNCKVDVIQRADEHLNGTGCRYCKGMIKDTAMYLRKANFVHNGKYLYNKTNFTKGYNKVIITCKKHGDFLQTAITHLNGHGCPKCNASKGEAKIMRYLQSKNIIFFHDKYYSEIINTQKCDSLLRFDFYLPKYQLFIEFDGRQHFIAENFGSNKISKKERLEIEQNRDRRKNNLFKNQNNNFRLLRISYKDYLKIEEILEHYLFTKS